MNENIDTLYNNDLLIKNNPSDLILLVQAICYDGSERSITILLDSTDDWKTCLVEDDIQTVLGFWGAMVMKWVETDMKIHYILLEYYQIINGEQKDVAKLRPFVRNGKKFTLAKFESGKGVDFLKNNKKG